MAPMRQRFEGFIAGVGSTSGIRVVVGHWPRSPFGSFTDAMVERASGRTVAGSLTDAVETVELWTFRRRPGGAPGDWMLSAIQQVS